MSGWRRCPRCGSGAVVERTSGCGGCLGCLVVIGVLMAIMSIIGGIFSGGFMEYPVRSVISSIFVIIIPIFFIYLLNKFGNSLYCKSCELHFKPSKK